MPDTRKNHNPSGAPDPTRVRAENNIQREEARVSLSTSCVMWRVPPGLKLWNESFSWITRRGGSIGEQNKE